MQAPASSFSSFLGVRVIFRSDSDGGWEVPGSHDSLPNYTPAWLWPTKYHQNATKQVERGEGINIKGSPTRGWAETLEPHGPLLWGKGTERESAVILGGCY